MSTEYEYPERLIKYITIGLSKYRIELSQSSSYGWSYLTWKLFDTCPYDEPWTSDHSFETGELAEKAALESLK